MKEIRHLACLALKSPGIALTAVIIRIFARNDKIRPLLRDRAETCIAHRVLFLQSRIDPGFGSSTLKLSESWLQRARSVCERFGRRGGVIVVNIALRMLAKKFRLKSCSPLLESGFECLHVTRACKGIGAI